MAELEKLANPEFEEPEGSRGFRFVTPVADNEDEGYMDFVQYLCL